MKKVDYLKEGNADRPIPMRMSLDGKSTPCFEVDEFEEDKASVRSKKSLIFSLNLTLSKKRHPLLPPTRLSHRSFCTKTF